MNDKVTEGADVTEVWQKHLGPFGPVGHFVHVDPFDRLNSLDPVILHKPPLMPR